MVGVTFDTGIPVEKSAQVANMIQRYVIENTRLGIPVLISEECPHGHQALDGTMLPTNLGIGRTWNPELYRKPHPRWQLRSGPVEGIWALYPPGYCSRSQVGAQRRVFRGRSLSCCQDGSCGRKRASGRNMGGT